MFLRFHKNIFEIHTICTANVPTVNADYPGPTIQLDAIWLPLQLMKSDTAWVWATRPCKIPSCTPITSAPGNVSSWTRMILRVCKRSMVSQNKRVLESFISRCSSQLSGKCLSHFLFLRNLISSCLYFTKVNGNLKYY